MNELSLPQMHTTVVVDCPPKPYQLYRLGWNAYCDGIAYATLTTDSERRGWKAANRAEAEAATAGYAESVGW